MRIQNLTVRNFRSLVDVEIPLHPLNVVIGPNGSGKTALMEVLLLLQLSLRIHPISSVGCNPMKF